jgi:hypothetical protein
LLAEGSGMVWIKLGGRNISLDDCLYVPSALQNLISVPSHKGRTHGNLHKGRVHNDFHLEQSGSLV